MTIAVSENELPTTISPPWCLSCCFMDMLRIACTCLRVDFTSCCHCLQIHYYFLVKRLHIFIFSINCTDCVLASTSVKREIVVHKSEIVVQKQTNNIYDGSIVD